MAERLVRRRIFDGVLVSGPTGGGVSSAVIFLGTDVTRMESIVYMASSVASNPDISLAYAVSPDNVTFGSFADNAALLTSTVSLTNPQGINTIAMPNALAPYIKFLLSSTGSNAVDTRVTADLFLRIS